MIHGKTKYDLALWKNKEPEKSGKQVGKELLGTDTDHRDRRAKPNDVKVSVMRGEMRERRKPIVSQTKTVSPSRVVPAVIGDGSLQNTCIIDLSRAPTLQKYLIFEGLKAYRKWLNK